MFLFFQCLKVKGWLDIFPYFLIFIVFFSITIQSPYTPIPSFLVSFQRLFSCDFFLSTALAASRKFCCIFIFIHLQVFSNFPCDLFYDLLLTSILFPHICKFSRAWHCLFSERLDHLSEFIYSPAPAPHSVKSVTVLQGAADLSVPIGTLVWQWFSQVSSLATPNSQTTLIIGCLYVFIFIFIFIVQQCPGE